MFSWFSSTPKVKESVEFTIKLDSGKFIEAIKRNSVKLIDALIAEKYNDIAFNNHILLTTAVTNDNKDFVEKFVHDKYKRIDASKINNDILDAVIETCNEDILCLLLENTKIIPSYDGNKLLKAFDIKDKENACVAIVSHPNFNPTSKYNLNEDGSEDITKDNDKNQSDIAHMVIKYNDAKKRIKKELKEKEEKELKENEEKVLKETEEKVLKENEEKELKETEEK